MNAMKKTARMSLIAAPVVLAAGVASAGGLAEAVSEPAPTPVPAPVPAPVVLGTDWTGFYAGGQLGYGQVDSDALAEEADGAVYGVHAGYMYDLGSLVLGAEVDYDASSIEGETADALDVELDSVARLKLMAGYDAGVWMPYLTAGVAQAAVSIDGEEADDTGNFAGLGVNYLLTEQIMVGGEVLQHSFEEFDDGADIDATTAALGVSFRF